MNTLDSVISGLGGASPALVLLALLLAYVLGNIIAWTYMFTHSGLSYSRSFVQSLVVLPIVLGMVMIVLSEAKSLVMAFGLMGAVAIVRFRNILKDTRDTAFLLLAMVCGLACGTYALTIGVVGTLFICIAFIVMYYTSFGTRHRYDVILNFRLQGGAAALSSLDELFGRHCRKAILASQRASGTAEEGDFSFRLLLRDPERSAEMVEELSESEGVSRISVIQRDDESEV